MSYVPPRRSDGTAQKRRVQQLWPPGQPFRILSIDGGGICGILPASVLAELETRFFGGGSIAQHFDMIAGTSTGGIIALGLAHGRTASQIRDLYCGPAGARIFPPAGPVGRLFRRMRRLTRYAYDSCALEEELLTIFGETPFGASRTRLCIPSFEGRHGEPWIYKTPHHPDYTRDRFERMVRVGLATSAAPTFLKALPNNGYLMVDGGLWANNAVMIALTDALSCFNVDRQHVRILSLGTGETSFEVDKSMSRGGILQWRHVFLAALRAQSLNALGQAYLLVGKENVLRVDAPESRSPIALDDYLRAKSELPAMARSLVEASGHRIEQLFLETRVQVYEPCPPRGIAEGPA
jgi:uncharacterized protein